MAAAVVVVAVVVVVVISIRTIVVEVVRPASRTIGTRTT